MHPYNHRTLKIKDQNSPIIEIISGKILNVDISFHFSFHDRALVFPQQSGVGAQQDVRIQWNVSETQRCNDYG